MWSANCIKIKQGGFFMCHLIMTYTVYHIQNGFVSFTLYLRQSIEEKYFSMRKEKLYAKKKNH